MNNLAPMKNCPWGGGVQGNIIWMPGYYHKRYLSDLILYVPLTIFSYKWTGLPGLLS